MEILGLLDALESIVLDSFKIPVTGKILVNESEILGIIDKMRLVCQKGENFAKESIVSDKNIYSKGEKPNISEVTDIKTISKDNLDEKAIEIIQQAYQIAKSIRQGADKYADEVLSNLEVTSSRILRTIKNGRSRLTRIIDSDEKPDNLQQNDGFSVEELLRKGN